MKQKWIYGPRPASNRAKSDLPFPNVVGAAPLTKEDVEVRVVATHQCEHGISVLAGVKVRNPARN